MQNTCPHGFHIVLSGFEKWCKNFGKGLGLMKSQVNFVYDFEDDPVDELKHWLFLENVKLNQQKQQMEFELEELEQMKTQFEKEKRKCNREFEMKEKKLERERDLFQKQWQIVERELVRMAKDRDMMAKEKERIQKEKESLKRQRQTVRGEVIVTEGTFFMGINSLSALKKRYRDLMKIYHPDNDNGDKNTVLMINREYDKIKKILCK